jgi:hypothetical protein
VRRYLVDEYVIQRWQGRRRVWEQETNEYPKTDRTHLALVLGIISLFIGPCGFIAFLMGDHCLKSIGAGLMDPAGETNARLGRLLGIVALCMFAIKVTIGAILVSIFGWPIPWTL